MSDDDLRREYLELRAKQQGQELAQRMEDKRHNDTQELLTEWARWRAENEKNPTSVGHWVRREWL